MTTTPATDTAAFDELLDMFSHPYRRWILTRLSNHSSRDEDKLVQQTLISEEGPDVSSVELFHNHLPKLEDADFIDWGQKNSVVRRGSRFDEIAPLIALLADHEDEFPAGCP